MATSSSINFNLNRDEIVTLALQRIQVLRNNTTVPTRDLEKANNVLNAMIKAWQLNGIFDYKTKESTVFTIGATAQYTIGSTGDHAVYTADLVSTTLSAAEALGQTTLSVTSVTGMVAADYIGIVLDDNTIQWTTIASVGASTVDVDDTLTAAAASGNAVYHYTTRLARPLKIDSIRFKNSSGSETTLEMYGRETYFNLPDKAQAGQPTAFYYNPNRDTSGTLYVYPVPADSLGRLKVTASFSVEDFDSATDDPDFSQESLEALYLNLALRLAPFYEKPIPFIGYLREEALMAYNTVLTSSLSTGGGDVQVSCE